jgi:hypothetical protein
MDMEIIAKVCTYLFYLKFSKNYNKIPCFVEMKSKQQDNIYGISKTKSMVLYYKVPTIIFLLPKLYVRNEILFPIILIFG